MQDFSITADKRPNRTKGSDGLARSSKNTPEPGVFSINNWKVICFFCLVFIGVVFFEYWQIIEIKEDLSVTRTELDTAVQSLKEITRQVSAADDNLNQSGSALHSEIKTINNEIRKLWDIANKRNRSEINDHSKKLDGLEKTAAQITKQVNKLQASATEFQTQNTGQIQGLKALTSEHSALKQSLATALDTFRGQISQWNKLAEDDKKRQADIEKSVDSFRLQVNRKLQQLENSVRKINQPANQGL